MPYLFIISLLFIVPECFGFYDCQLGMPLVKVHIITNSRTRNQMLMMPFIQISGLFVKVKAGRKDFLLSMKMPQLGLRFWKGLNSFQIPK